MRIRKIISDSNDMKFTPNVILPSPSPISPSSSRPSSEKLLFQSFYRSHRISGLLFLHFLLLASLVQDTACISNKLLKSSSKVKVIDGQINGISGSLLRFLLSNNTFEIASSSNMSSWPAIFDEYSNGSNSGDFTDNESSVVGWSNTNHYESTSSDSYVAQQLNQQNFLKFFNVNSAAVRFLDMEESGDVSNGLYLSSAGSRPRNNYDFAATTARSTLFQQTQSQGKYLIYI